MIVVKTVGAELREGFVRRSRARRRSPGPAPEGDAAEPVTVTRVTIVRGDAFEDRAGAQDWLARCGKAARADEEVDESLRLLNRAIQAHRVAAADPYAADVSRQHARRVRIGYGSGDELLEGRWSEAVEVTHTDAPRRRRRMLAPEDQLARILGGRRPTHPSEDLLLRARLDLDQGRTREAALQAQVAQRALGAEQEGEAPGVLDAVARSALERELSADEVSALEDAVAAMERVVRRRRHAADDER